MTPENRAALHAELDSIIDADSALDEASEMAAQEGGINIIAGTMMESLNHYRRGVRFIATVIGSNIARSKWPTSSVADRRYSLALFLSFIKPLAPADIAIDEGISALSALDSGEVTPFLTPRSYVRLPHKQNWHVAQAKLAALSWRAILIQQFSKSDTEAESIISEAYNVDWSTMLKWKRQCERDLGKNYVRLSLKLPITMVDDAFDSLTFDQALAADARRFKSLQ